MPGQRGLRGATGSEGHNGVGDAVESAVVEAAHRAGEIDNAVRLTALDDGDPSERPVVEHLSGEGPLVVELRQNEAVGKVEYVLAVEVGGSVAAAKVIGIVAVVEKSQCALLIGGVREGIGHAGLEAMAEPFFHVRLQSVVGGDTGRCIRLGLRRVADVGNA